MSIKISTKSRYALRLLIDLCQHQDVDVVSLRDIAYRQKISKKYLEQIVADLNIAGYLRTTRGHAGGYTLAVDPATITLADVMRAVETNMEMMPCLDDDRLCEQSGNCVPRSVWDGLRKVIFDYLESMTVKDVADRTPMLEGGCRLDNLQQKSNVKNDTSSLRQIPIEPLDE